jgi:hypothetical protein
MDGKEQPAFLKNMMGSVFSSMSADNIRKSSLVSLLSCLLTLGGAIMMWTLRRTGYYVYIAGIVISIGTPMLFFPGTVGMIGSGFAAFIGLLFVGLYGMNLKDMTQ